MKREQSRLVGNTSIHNIDAEWLRSQIGLVQQEAFLFNDTIYKNVAFGLCGTEWQKRVSLAKLDNVVYQYPAHFSRFSYPTTLTRVLFFHNASPNSRSTNSISY
jgi:ABC-type multidrug transport system fused ATPase/permease subunit